MTDSSTGAVRFTEKPRGTLGRAWDDWWAERERLVTRGVQIVLGLFVGLCLLLFMNLQWEGRALPTEGGQSLWNSKVVVGLPFSHWLQIETNRDANGSGGLSLVFFSWSWLVLLAGYAAWCMSWQIERAKAKATGKQLRWWHGSPSLGVAVCTAAVVLSVIGALIIV
jgi:hypothetical protein